MFCAIIVTVEGIQAGLLFARKALHLSQSCYSLDKNGKHSGGAFCVSEQMMTVEIPLTKGRMAVIDDEYNDLAAMKWHYHIDYAYHTINRSKQSKVSLALHRVILERKLNRKLEKTEYVDHIDGSGLNNRRANLRLANNSLNQANSKLRNSNTSGYKGVTYHKQAQKWQAQIKVGGRNFYLGLFDTVELAHSAYCVAAKSHFGKYWRKA